MKLVSHGVDIVDVSRVRKLLSDKEFELAWFTAVELEMAETRQDKAIFYAGRVAAKEAVVKALATGFTRNISPIDIEIRTQESGAPTVILSTEAHAVANQLGVNRWSLSISHTDQLAIATALAFHDDI